VEVAAKFIEVNLSESLWNSFIIYHFIRYLPEVSKFLVDVERVEDSSLVLGVETVVVAD
jgi:hypothetical protein